MLDEKGGKQTVAYNDADDISRLDYKSPGVYIAYIAFGILILFICYRLYYYPEKVWNFYVRFIDKGGMPTKSAIVHYRTMGVIIAVLSSIVYIGIFYMLLA